MLRRSGQAARWILHVVAEILLGLALLGVLATGVLAWRLAEGPIDLGFLLPRLSAALSGRPGRPSVRVGAASLAWEGFRQGLESPLDLVLADVVIAGSNNSGMATIPRAEVSLSMPALLLGRIVPRRIVIEAPRLHIVRERSGGLALSFGSRRGGQARGARNEPSASTLRLAGEIVSALAAPPGDDGSAPRPGLPWLSQLRSLTIRDAEITVVDQALGATWYAPSADITLTRGALGGLTANARIVLALAGHQAVLSVEGDLEAHRGLDLAARLSAVTPAELASAAPRLSPLMAVNAPVRLALTLTFGPSFALRRARLEANVGGGRIVFGGGSVPIAGGALAISAEGNALKLGQVVLRLAAPSGAAEPMVTGSGSAQRDAAGIWQGRLSLATGAVPMADLARYWPPDISRGGRAWVSRNITGGTAETATLTVGLAYAPSGGALALNSVSGRVSASGLVVHWLRPIPPLTDGRATLSIGGPDAMTITVQHAIEGRLQVTGGTVGITGLEENDQNAAITARISGPLGDALALLKEPRLGLLARHPLPISTAAGNADVTVSVALPLLAKLTMDQVAVHAEATLAAVRLGGIAAGRDLTEGSFHLSADNEGLTMAGTAALAGIPTRLSSAMDFRAGPPGQVVQRLEASATPTAEELAQLHILDVTSVVEGPLVLSGEITVARDGVTSARIKAGLTGARLSVAPLGFVKPAGAAAAADAVLRLAHGRIAAIDTFDLTGTGIAALGSASFAGGRPIFVRVDQARLGRTEASGSVRFPGEGQPIAIVLNGPLLDLSARFTHHGPGPSKSRAAGASAAREAPWVLDARFTRALLAHDQPLTECVLRAESDGVRITAASLTGNLAPGEPASFVISPERAARAQGRAVAITAANAGDLLAATDITDKIKGGKLTVTARLGDAAAGSPLAGTATISDFRVQNAPALGRVLQAMTLYGLADVLAGPGLAFSKLIVPFRLSGHTLSLTKVRAFSPSLGLTAEGHIDLATETAELSGTIVPAYFFNSLLGNIPLIGRLFSPEKGGGLFAATYSVAGPLGDPKVGINPLAALTPGFLRELFQIF